MDLVTLVRKKNIYFLGIGGIGMSALARYFKIIGKDVAGYDRSESRLTRLLEKEGIEVVYDPDLTAVPQQYLNTEDTLIVRTPAVPFDNPQYKWFRENDFNICKRSELLGLITKAQKSICVAGTHGKTTISTMVSHIMRNSWLDCNAFLGGISKNYQTNLLLSSESDLTVIEADEFDRSFLSLEPWIATISSIDADHLDIYGTHDNIKESFSDFTHLIRTDGFLIVKKSIDFTPNVKLGVKILTYSLDDPNADFYAAEIDFKSGVYHFDLHFNGEVYLRLKLGVPGLINVENAIVASAAAITAGCSEKDLRSALASFQGVSRRLDVQYDGLNGYFMDDYAHHPKELTAVISSVRAMMPRRKITGIFQPHLFSRTNDFKDEFAESLSLLDELILLDIYPARELPIEGVTSKLIFDKVSIDNKLMVRGEMVLDVLKDREIDVLLTMGAGDIDKLVPEIKNMLERKDVNLE